MARLIMVFLASLMLFVILLAQHETQAHPQYKTIANIVVHAHHHHHQAALVPIHQ